MVGIARCLCEAPATSSGSAILVRLTHIPGLPRPSLGRIEGHRSGSFAPAWSGRRPPKALWAALLAILLGLLDIFVTKCAKNRRSNLIRGCCPSKARFAPARV